MYGLEKKNIPIENVEIDIKIFILFLVFNMLKNNEATPSNDINKDTTK